MNDNKIWWNVAIYWQGHLDILECYDNEKQARHSLMIHEQCTDDVRRYKLSMLDQTGWHVIEDYCC